MHTHAIVCDACGAKQEDVWGSDQHVAVVPESWWIVPGGKHLCPDCQVKVATAVAPK